MRYQISGKNITVTEGISSQITRKLSKMDKYFHPDDDVLARVVVRVYKASNEAKVEVTIFSKDTTFRAEVKNQDLWRQIHELTKNYTISWNWVKGHDNHPQNERCDALAVAATPQKR